MYPLPSLGEFILLAALGLAVFVIRVWPTGAGDEGVRTHKVTTAPIPEDMMPKGSRPEEAED